MADRGGGLRPIGDLVGGKYCGRNIGHEGPTPNDEFCPIAALPHFTSFSQLHGDPSGVKAANPDLRTPPTMVLNRRASEPFFFSLKKRGLVPSWPLGNSSIDILKPILPLAHSGRGEHPFPSFRHKVSDTSFRKSLLPQGPAPAGILEPRAVAANYLHRGFPAKKIFRGPGPTSPENDRGERGSRFPTMLEGHGPDQRHPRPKWRKLSGFKIFELSPLIRFPLTMERNRSPFRSLGKLNWKRC